MHAGIAYDNLTASANSTMLGRSCMTIEELPSVTRMFSKIDETVNWIDHLAGQLHRFLMLLRWLFGQSMRLCPAVKIR